MKNLVLQSISSFIVVFLLIMTGYNMATPPCEEDEAYVVMEDADPNHGLRWGCITLDELHAHLDGRR